MDFQLIDYSDYYFGELAGKPVPANRGGKFVQIRNEESGTEFLVLSPAQLSMYHANIVERFCSLSGLDGHWTSGRSSYRFVDPSWSVIGGGRWVSTAGEKRLELGSNSQAYGRFDAAGLEKKIRSLDAMKGYVISVRS